MEDRTADKPLSQHDVITMFMPVRDYMIFMMGIISKDRPEVAMSCLDVLNNFANFVVGNPYKIPSAVDLLKFPGDVNKTDEHTD